MAARLTAEFLKDWKNEVNPDLQKERDTCTFNTQELTTILDGGQDRTKRRKEFEKLVFYLVNEAQMPGKGADSVVSMTRYYLKYYIVWGRVDLDSTDPDQTLRQELSDQETLFFTKYADLFSFKKRPFRTRSELYEDSVAKSVKVFELRREHGWTEEDFELAVRILNYDFALSLHHTMFIPALERLATDEQKAKWLPLAQSYQIVGTYAQTELGHGTYLLGLETTATFDHATDEFVMSTPKLTSMKWWPGGLAKSCTHALVLAQLVIDGQNKGMHPFLVQLRSLDDHMPMPGIKVGDIGSKIGANSTDNGYLILERVRVSRGNMLMRNAVGIPKCSMLALQNTPRGVFCNASMLHLTVTCIRVGDIGPKKAWNFMDNGYLIMDQVRIPRGQMLMRHSQVTRQGKFSQLSGNKANYATMILVRVNIVMWSFESMRHAATVGVRYSATRRQTTLKPGTPEQQVLDFQTQQYKIFPAVATAYAAFFVAKEMFALYNLAHGEIMRGNTSRLAELHAQSSGLKAFLTDKSTYLVEICRRSCGGHGFLMSSGVAENASSGLALATIEGDNTILYLQTARYLMKQMANAVSGTKTTGSTGYMNRDFGAYLCPLESQADCRNMAKVIEVYRQRAQKVVMATAQKLQISMESGQPQEVVFNNNMVSLVRAGKAHIQLSVSETFITSLEALRPTVSPQLYAALMDVCAFFCLHGIVEEAGDFLEMETLGLSQIEWIRQEELALLADIRPNAVGLVDSFDLHDETVASALGSFDGNAYQRLFESTQYEPMNQTEVHPAYYKHLKGLLNHNKTKARL